MGFLNEDGSINENKEDEWEFFWRFNCSNFINISIFLYIILYIL